MGKMKKKKLGGKQNIQLNSVCFLPEDVRGIHINEDDELVYPNNATFSWVEYLPRRDRIFGFRSASSKSSNFSFEFRTLKQFGKWDTR